jgi:hypothetical protein
MREHSRRLGQTAVLIHDPAGGKSPISLDLRRWLIDTKVGRRSAAGAGKRGLVAVLPIGVRQQSVYQRRTPLSERRRHRMASVPAPSFTCAGTCDVNVSDHESVSTSS